jgi:glycosyltransferase involved in cell wall biosynthesis
MRRVAVDMSILRHPAAGTSRYATEVLAALPDALGPSFELVVARAYPRARWHSPVRRPVNLAADLAWMTVGSLATAAMRKVDVWYSPSNILPIGLPRPEVVTIHDVNLLDPDAGYDRAYVRFAAPHFARSARAARTIVTHSHHAGGTIAAAFGVDPAKILVAYPGIDHIQVRADMGWPPPDHPYALWVGRTEPHKNVPLLIEAWGHHPLDGLHLIIAGPEGRAEPRIREMIERSPARDRVHRLGAVGEDHLSRLYAQASCFLFPSLAEGFGLPPLEAMRLGVPTAVAAASCLPEVTGGAALLFDPHDPASVVDVVQRLAMPSVIERAASTGPEVARRYTWASTATSIAGAIKALGGRSR